MEKCKQTRKHTCTFTTLFCSSQCNHSRKRQQFYRLVKLCSEHGCSYEWKNGENPRLTKNRKTITSYLLSYQDCHHLPAAARLLHQDQRISQNLSVSPKHHQIQWRLEVPSMHAGNRCRQTLTSKPRETVVQHTDKMRRTKKFQRKAFRIGYSPSQLIWRTCRRMCPHIPLTERSQIRKVMLQKWRHEKEAQYLFSLPQRPKLRHMPDNQNYEGSLQKTR